MCLHTFHWYHHCQHVGRWDIEICFDDVANQVSDLPSGEFGIEVTIRNVKSLCTSFVCKNMKIQDLYLVENNKVAGFCPKCIYLGLNKPICIVTGIAPDDPKWAPKEDTDDEDDKEFEKGIQAYAAKIMAGASEKVEGMSMEEENWEDIFFDDDDDLEDEDGEEDEYSGQDDAEEEDSTPYADALVKKAVGEPEFS